MDLWWIGLLCVALLVLALLLLPLDVAASLQARGEPNGAYAAAGGVQLGPIAATFVLTQSMPLLMELRIWGRVVKRSEQPVAPAEPKPHPERRHAEREPTIAALDWIWFLLGERHRIRLRWADVQLEYSFRNVALTGQLTGALSALSSFLPRRVRLVQSPSWELVDRAALALDGRIRLWPGLLFLDCLRFWVRSTMLPKSDSAALEPASTHPIK